MPRRMATGTQPQMTGLATLIEKMLGIPDVDTVRWAVAELLSDGTTWGLCVSLKPRVQAARQKVIDLGIDAVLVDLNTRTGSSYTKPQLQNALDAIRDAVAQTSKSEADALTDPNRVGP